MRDWEKYNVFMPLSPSSFQELEALREEALEEAKMLFGKIGRFKATKFLKALIIDVDVHKILGDMYVWQRVDAIKIGIVEAISQLEDFAVNRR